MASRNKLLNPGNSFTEIIAQVIGMLGFLFEPVSKHTTYLGFYTPKFFTVVLGTAITRGYFKDFSLRTPLQIMAFAGIIGLAHSRHHYDQELSAKAKPSEETPAIEEEASFKKV